MSNEDSITNTQPTPTDMEVHHHTPHGHEKKTWKSYFWEFFMLFLAVFCGSMAELKVEHYIEHQREYKYAETLLEDMVNDTLDLSDDIKYWSTVDKKVDTLRTEIDKPIALRNQLLIYSCLPVISNNNSFLYHDRTIQQLKSSGNFRLMRKGKIADSLVNYDAWIQKTLNQIENEYLLNTRPQTSLLRNQLFNSKFYSIARNKAKLDSALLLDPQVIDIKGGKDDLLFQFYNQLGDYQSLNKNRLRFQKLLIDKATNIIKMLKEEYHLE